MKQNWFVFWCWFQLSNGQRYSGDEEYSRNPYTYRYNVAVPETYNNYEVYESGDEKVVSGSYKVDLPDGRTQIVTYEVHPVKGYQAKVKYEGEAVYPDTPNYNPSPYGPPEPIKPYGTARNLKRQAPASKPLKHPKKNKRKLGKKHNIDIQNFEQEYSLDILESNRVPRKIEYIILDDKVKKKKSPSQTKKVEYSILDDTEDQKTSPSRIEFSKPKKSSQSKKVKPNREREDFYDDTPDAPQAEPLSLQSSYQPKPRKTTKKPQPSTTTHKPKPSAHTKKLKPSKITLKPVSSLKPHRPKPSIPTQNPKPIIVTAKSNTTPKLESEKTEPTSQTKASEEPKQSNKPWLNCNDFETCFENVKLLLGNNVKEEKLGTPAVPVTRPPTFSPDSIVDQVFALPASLPVPPTTTAIYTISPEYIKSSNQIKRKINSKHRDEEDSVPLDSYQTVVFVSPPSPNISESKSSQTKHQNNLINLPQQDSSIFTTSRPSNITTLWRKDVAKFRPIIINTAENKTEHQPISENSLKAVPAIPTNAYEYTTIIPHQLPERTKPKFFIKAIGQLDKQKPQITPSRLTTAKAGRLGSNAAVITPNTPVNTGIKHQEGPTLYYGPNSQYVLYSGPPRYLRHANVQPTPSIKVFNPYEYPTINSPDRHHSNSDINTEETQLGSESQIHFYKPTVILPGLVRALPPKQPDVVKWKTKTPIVYKSLKDAEKASNNLKKSILSNTKLLRKSTLKSNKKTEATTKAIAKIKKLKVTRYDETPFISKDPKRSSTIPTQRPKDTNYVPRGLSKRTREIALKNHPTSITRNTPHDVANDFEDESVEAGNDDSLDYYEDYNGFPFGARLPSFISPVANSLASSDSTKMLKTSEAATGVQYVPVSRDVSVSYSPVHKGSTVRLIYSGDSYVPEYQSKHKN